jgi:ribonuclease Z
MDFGGHSAVLSGDTTFNENLIRHASGADLLIHEVTAASGGAAESAEQLKRISGNHTTPVQAGEVFCRARPKLAVYNHLLLFGGATANDLIPATRASYSGPLLVGEDLMQMEIGETVTAHWSVPQDQSIPITPR